MLSDHAATTDDDDGDGDINKKEQLNVDRLYSSNNNSTQQNSTLLALVTDGPFESTTSEKLKSFSYFAFCMQLYATCKM